MLPTSALQISNVPGADGLHAIQTGGGGGGTIVQYATQTPDGQFFVPGKLLSICLKRKKILFFSIIHFSSHK